MCGEKFDPDFFTAVYRGEESSRVGNQIPRETCRTLENAHRAKWLRAPQPVL